MRRIDLISVSGWDKLTEKQLLIIARLMAQPKYEKSLVTKAFLAINGMRVKKGYVITKTDDHVYKSYKFQKNGKRIFLISANIFASMVKKFDWLDEDITLFRCLSRIGRFKASDYRLFDTTLEQFLFADNLYNAFLSTGRYSFLRQLTAVYYHRQKEKYDSSKIARRSRRFLFTKRVNIYATYLWFTGIKRWIMDRYPYIFNQSGSGEVTSPDQSILEILSALNQGDITRNTQILKSHIHEALHQLNIMAENSKNYNV